MGAWAALLAVPLLATVPASAETGIPACDDPRTTVEMVTCAGAELEREERVLQLLLEERQAEVDETAERLLEQSQAAWSAYRDAECARQRDEGRGGTIAPLLEIGCRSDLTQRRIREIGRAAFGEGPPRTDDGAQVFWSARFVGFETFDCSTPEEARLGLVASTGPQGLPRLSVRVGIGSRTLDVPVGGDTQASLFAPTVTLQVVAEPGDPCADLVLDDGYTDSIRISWDPEAQAFAWSRN